MPHSEITREQILEMLANNGFGDLVDGQIVNISRQEQLNRALTLACECGFLDLVKHLHDEGAEVSHSDALLAAAEFDQLPIIEYLLASGADIDCRSPQFRQTALMDAAGSASVSVVRFLIDAGADNSATDDEGKTALDWANIGRHMAALPEMRADEHVLKDYDTIIELLTGN